jgi:hypothetical protein
MNRKAKTYSVGVEVEDDTINIKLRMAARNINVEEPLSDEWLSVSLDLETLCNHSNLEAQSEETKGADAVGKST